jgi:DNA-binding response OmpR family regulator
MPRKRQALIVEDDAELTSELESLLGRLGFEVTRIQEPDRVEETIGNHVYEVALLNATLPDLSWRRTLRAVKNASPTTTVIMITRHAGEEDIRVALNAGAYAAVERPLSQQKLTTLISPQCDGLFVALRG